MDSYYANQATFLPHFSGHYRQRGSGFGALAAGAGRVPLPLARRFILPTAKRIGKELLKQIALDILDKVFFTAFFGDFLLLTTSIILGTHSFRSSFPMRLVVGRMKRRASGRATRPMPADKAPKPLPLCR